MLNSFYLQRQQHGIGAADREAAGERDSDWLAERIAEALERSAT